ncbi:hypothetical protein CGRA01v4_07024 [Colletotrichum graminicola]|nr:hypothetical protein CGRA01v4_07024 [Colletotrichum graminicola]
MQALTANPAPYMLSTELAGKSSLERSHSSNSLRSDRASSRSTSWNTRSVTITGEVVANLSVRLKAISGSPLTIIEPAHGLVIGESLIRRVHRIMPCIVRILSCAMSLPLTSLHPPERRLSHRRTTRTLPDFRQLEGGSRPVLEPAERCYRVPIAPIATKRPPWSRHGACSLRCEPGAPTRYENIRATPSKAKENETNRILCQGCLG